MAEIARGIEDRLRERRYLAGRVLPDRFVLPAYEGYSLANIPATVLAHFGVPGPPTPPLNPEATGGFLKGSRKVVVLLVDAMGYLSLARQMAGDPDLVFNGLARRGRFVPLTSIFPSTTAATLSTLHTGLPPAGHGIVGYRMYLPERGVLANMIRFSPEAEERPNLLLRDRADARAWLGAPTVHRRLVRAGVRSFCLIEKTILGSGLSRVLYDDATATLPFVGASDLFVRIRKLLETDPGEPACIWAYWGALDDVQHLYGTRGEEPAAEVRNLAYSLGTELLEPMRRSRPSGATLLLTADHGHVHVSERDVIPARNLGKLREALAAPPSGTGRAPYLHLREGFVDSTMACLSRALKGRALVIRSRSALSEGLWGPGKVRAGVPARLGNLLLLMGDARILFYPYRKGALPSGMAGGTHGGLHEEEMLVPFFCVRL